MGPGVAGADLHYQAQKERERLLEKAQRHEEVNEFRKATSEHKIEKSLTRVEKVPLTAPVVGPEAGPQAKKRIPTFVKLKSKDSFEEVKETKPMQEPDSKRQRTDDGGAGTEGTSQAPLNAAASSPTSSPAGGSLLGGYESSDEGEEEDA